MRTKIDGVRVPPDIDVSSAQQRRSEHLHAASDGFINTSSVDKVDMQFEGQFLSSFERNT